MGFLALPPTPLSQQALDGGGKIQYSFLVKQSQSTQEESNMLFIEYPKCSTCQKAKRWLESHQIEYTARHIKEENPSYEELERWYAQSGLPLKRFFNTSGLVYKSLGLKDKLPAMSVEEQLRLLASDGMLVKRPLLIGDGVVLTGFREAEWERALL